MSQHNNKPKKRPSRVPYDSVVHLVRAGHSWTTELVDISATGMLVERPDQWLGQEDDEFVIDLVLHDRLNIHLQAKVARVTTNAIGLHFTYIPPETEQAFWSFLGEYADKTEPL